MEVDGRRGSLVIGGRWKALWPWVVLLVAGVGWGFSFSLAKIAAIGGAHPLGITFWQCTTGAILTICFTATRSRPRAMKHGPIWLYVACGLLGLVIPNTAFFYAASRVSAGVLAITIAIVPILTYAISALWGLERFVLVRVTGVMFGAISIVLLFAPNESLPDPAQSLWVLLAFGSAACYAAMNLVLALYMPEDQSALSVTSGMFVAAALMMLPIVFATNSFVPLGWPLSAAGWAALGLGVNSAICYALYVYLVNHAGPVFGSQTANVVTLSGVLWGIMIFGDRHSLWIWLSLATMMAGLALVAPHEKEIRA
jgi:drug/metabolite transporter (DMT)-like permease